MCSLILKIKATIEIAIVSYFENLNPTNVGLYFEIRIPSRLHFVCAINLNCDISTLRAFH